jgi:hypothetical protein
MLHAATVRAGGRLALGRIQSGSIFSQTRRAGFCGNVKGACEQRKPPTSFPMDDAQDLEASNQVLDMRSHHL